MDVLGAVPVASVSDPVKEHATHPEIANGKYFLYTVCDNLNLIITSVNCIPICHCDTKRGMKFLEAPRAGGKLIEIPVLKGMADCPFHHTLPL